MSSPRHTNVEVTWQTAGGAPTDIIRQLGPDLLGIDYADNLTGAADDLTFDIQDIGDRWSGDWQPQNGDTVVARLKGKPWLTTVEDLRLGVFAYDRIGMSGPPSRVQLSCCSAPLATGLRRRKRTRVWQGVTLKKIAQDIADRAQLELGWDGAPGLVYKSAMQSDKSDLEFLDELCKDVGRNLKVTEGKLAIFDELARDTSPSVGSLSLRGGNVLNYNFDSDDSARYGNVVVTFFDPRTGKTQKGQYPPDGSSVEGLDPDGQTLELRLPVDSIGQAQAIAKARLRNANRFGTSGRLSVVGDPGLVAGVTFDLTDARAFNGKFIIAKATHKPLAGYTCDLVIRRCLETF